MNIPILFNTYVQTFDIMQFLIFFKWYAWFLNGTRTLGIQYFWGKLDLSKEEYKRLFIPPKDV